jgi:multiple sugar transport system ATP-binding protein
MRTEIKRLHQSMKTTIVYVTHDQIEAMTLATRIAVLKDGILQQFGTPAEIYNHPANMFVADFMGSPAMNLIPASVERSGKDLRLSMPQRSGSPMTLALPEAVKGIANHAGGNVIFGIRPEALTDPDGADRNSTGVVTSECQIEVVEPAGSDTFAVTHLGGKEVIARLRADAKVSPGKKATLAFNLDKAVFFDPGTQQRIA